MKNPIKLLDDEIKEILSLKEKIQSNTLEFGILYQERMQIEDEIKKTDVKETKLREDLVVLKKENINIMNKLINKYGEGDLNLKDGVFTPY